MDLPPTKVWFGNRPRKTGVRVSGAAVFALSALLVTAFAGAAQAQNLVTNGSFSQLLIQSSAEFGTVNNGFTPTQQLTGWTTAGYNFVFLPGTVDTTGATGQYNTVATTGTPGLTLWGPNSPKGPANGLATASPTGGNFIAADGAYEVSAITQTINGLTPGHAVAVSFAWAGAQQYGFNGATTDNWTVSLGTVTASNLAQTTKTVNLPDEGFTGWLTQTFTFMPTSTSEVLSFLATGTPTGQPPFALLANVSAANVPEPAAWTVMMSGLAGLILFARRRRQPGPLYQSAG
jgi:PEP-CTERM motif